MQILRVPFHYEDMTAQATMTGITVLNSGKFKQRHGGPREIVQKPVDGLILRKNDLLERNRLINLKQVKSKRKPKSDNPGQSKKVQRNYTINKREVTHRIRNYVNQMQNEKKLYFWTITFPAGTSDDTAFICYNKWLTRVRKELNLRSYLWITERQTNGTIHFHIAIHQRLCVKKANRFMRACLFTSIDNKEIVYTREAAKNYNGVDIAKNRKTKRVTNFAQKKSAKTLVNYLTKYITKNDGKFTHLAWHSSRDYSNLITSIRLTEKEFEESGIKNYLLPDAIFQSEWFTFYRWYKEPPPDLIKYLAFINQKALSLLNQ